MLFSKVVHENGEGHVGVDDPPNATTGKSQPCFSCSWGTVENGVTNPCNRKELKQTASKFNSWVGEAKQSGQKYEGKYVLQVVEVRSEMKIICDI